jgi:hypothetical protein
MGPKYSSSDSIQSLVTGFNNTMRENNDHICMVTYGHDDSYSGTIKPGHSVTESVTPILPPSDSSLDKDTHKRINKQDEYSDGYTAEPEETDDDDRIPF